MMMTRQAQAPLTFRDGAECSPTLLRMHPMLPVADTLSNLRRLLRQWAQVLADLTAWDRIVQATPTRLREVTDFGSNPGNLRMFTYTPDPLPNSAALVVVLHGCTQTAIGYDHGAGWSTLADRYRFALLFPEQQPSNNLGRCFNWFLPEDSTRDHGEALSIRQMIEHSIRTRGIDRRRVFVTGLSAGGAMTSVMLATYPELFAGGAIVAGGPYRCATSAAEALTSMFQGQVRSAQEWGDLVRAASTHRGPWPKVSVWHGDADRTVAVVNAAEVVKQWTNLHGLPAAPSRQEIVDGHPRRVWVNAAGEEVVEDYIISGMSHGAPIALSMGDQRHGTAGPFSLDVGISSSYHMVKFWDLTAPRVEPVPSLPTRAEEVPVPSMAQAAASSRNWSARVRSVITRIRRAIGLSE
jgi:poly(hydroxyalkanoate) depolymerase family esterase